MDTWTLQVDLRVLHDVPDGDIRSADRVVAWCSSVFLPKPTYEIYRPAMLSTDVAWVVCKEA